jgi:MFS family permease
MVPRVGCSFAAPGVACEVKRLARSPRLRLLAPLAHRDFAVLWAGVSVSLVGDGVYFVAIVWQAYEISDTPSALSVVGVAWLLPSVVFALVGGAVSDRLPRRRVLMVSALAQAAAIGAVGTFAIAGELKLWILAALVAVYGAAQAFYGPAFEALVPTLVPARDIPQASALDRFVRQLATQIAGPALGGVLIAADGTGAAFVFDATTFLAAAGAVLATAREGRPEGDLRPGRRAIGDVADGFRFVRANAWIWGTLLAASLFLLFFVGPSQVLVPFVVRNNLHASAATFGEIRAVAGVGAITAAVVVAQRGLPRCCTTVMLCAWALQALALVAYGLASAVWIFLVASVAGGAARAVGDVIWGTLIKTHVPNELLGRVASLDWLVSIALVPASFALATPLSALLGARTVLIVAGPTAAAAMLSFPALRGIRDPEASRSGQNDPGPLRSQATTAPGPGLVASIQPVSGASQRVVPPLAADTGSWE